MNAVRVPVTRWPAHAPAATCIDEVATEEPLEIRVGGRSIAVTMRTPGRDRELAAGFLLTEGVIGAPGDVRDILVCRDLPEGNEGNVVDALLAPHVGVDYARLTRHVFSSSSCGVCGKATLEATLRKSPPVAAGPGFEPAMLALLPDRLRSGQPGFAATGGLHASALFDRAGKLLCLREDVGRHNALDKVLGWALLAGLIPLRETVLVVSGRVSFELVQKALVAGIPLVAGIGAPSSLAVECARLGGQTLVGFLRRERFNVYAGAERLEGAGPEQRAGGGSMGQREQGAGRGGPNLAQPEIPAREDNLSKDNE
jgi:FdhD protein